MTSKERLYNAIAGKEVDRTPYAPFLIFWWESRSPEIRDMGEMAMCRRLGVDPLIRGHYPTHSARETYRDLFVVDTHYRNCEITEKISGKEKLRQYETKVGTLKSKYMFDPNMKAWFLVEHPLKTCEDYKILQYIMENAKLSLAPEGFESIVKEYGDEMLVAPRLVPGYKTAFQSMVEHWAGTAGFIDMLDEEEELVEQTMDVIRELNRESVRLCSQTEAEVFISFEDSSTTNYSPRMYEAYAVPELNAWCDTLHKENKLLIQHACGHIKHLLPAIANSRIDCLESVTPYPTGNVTMEEVAAALPSRISVIGGIDPMLLLNGTWEEVEAYAKNLLDTMKGRGYVLANSDSCPPGVKQEYLEKLSQLVR